MQQPPIVWIGVAVVVLVVLAAFWFVMQQRRRRELQDRFGPEYERVVREEGDERRAERVLSDREQRVKKLDIRPLPASTREDLLRRWRKVQERFVDDPRGAVVDADKLIGEAMVARGYPVADFEQRAADISVEHPRLVNDYRAAHDIAMSDRRERVTTEQLRRAMVHYRSLFEDVVAAEGRPDETVEEREESRR